MTKASLEQHKTDASDVELQPASVDIWDKKYRLKAKSGQVIDHTIDDTFKRVASALAAVEQTSDCLLYTSPSPRDLSTSRMPSSA